jgi:hypothetical protein
VNFS